MAAGSRSTRTCSSDAWYLAQALIAAESLGAVQTCLDESSQYAKERFTFGRAIGSYQAVKHELTEVLRRMENARGLQYYAGWARESKPDEFPLAASAARSAAGEALDFAARSMINVHGGIGATWEHDAPLFFRRAAALAPAAGRTHDATDRVAERTLVTAAARSSMTAIDDHDPAREVLNQAPPLQPINLFESDLALGEALEREGGGWGVDRVREAGAVAGSVEAAEHGRRAERNQPILRTHDRYGNRIDEVELDPSWHWLLRGAVERSIARLPWREPGRGRTWSGRRCSCSGATPTTGVMCPVSMTYAAVPALRDGAPELAAEWEPRLTRPDYDRGALAGMAMTERQGGSDVRANITRAEPVGDGDYELHGHKWFCSYPPCDVFLVLAQAPGGLSCFLVERGPGMEFQRLKDKLGTRSLPSSEVEFRGIAAG